VRVSDPHGVTGTAGTLLRVDGLRPVLSQLRVRGGTIAYRLSEAARVTIRLQRLVHRRWRAVRTLQQNGEAGKNRLTPNARAHAAKRRTKRVRYRAEAVAVDAVGNRSATVRLKVSAAAAKKLRRHRR
jgi:ribosomal protein L28